MIKKLLLFPLVLLALAVASPVAGRWYVARAEPDYGQDAVLPGLRAPVEIWRDSMGVPHLWADDEIDLARALGYVHAQDRLWQMEFFRRVADGRLAEILGADLVDTDRFLRVVGMGRAAAEEERTLEEPEAARLRAYAEGVNAWITEQSGALAPEFLALRFAPEPWTVRNTLAVGKIMSWDLAEWELGLDVQRAVDRLGAERARQVYPGYPEWGVRILGPGEAPASPVLPAVARPASLRTGPLPRLSPLTVRILESVSVSRASNSWVVGGDRTRSGKPILANDPHLALRAPALWYMAALHGGDTQVAGATIPGIPSVVLGHTPRVAWGFTNAMVDDVDFFVEQVDPQDGTRYRTPTGWAAFAVREEWIQVKDAEPVLQRVRRSRHGPVISDVDPRAGGRVLAMRWTALEPSSTSRALLGMNRARSVDQFLSALRHFDDPHQNVVFADADGAFGYWLAGRVPVRSSGDGVLPVPGWTGEGEWQRYLAWEELPHVIRPAEGFVVTANNRQHGPEYPFHLGTNWADPFRAMRIRDLVAQASRLDAAEVARQQMDVRDLFAVRYLPHAVRAADLAGEGEAARLLRGWDAQATLDSRAAAIFYTWYEELRRRVGYDEFGGEGVFFPRYALNRLLDAGGGTWADDVGTAATETLDEQSAAAMREAVRSAAGRTWGDLHTTQIAHALGTVEALDRLLSLDLGPFPNVGSPFTVNVAGYGSRAPFVNTHGASMRHVVDLGDPDGAGGFILPGGQSGVPTSPHYRDQLPLWRSGRLWKIPLNRRLASERAVQRMTLRPAK